MNHVGPAIILRYQTKEISLGKSPKPICPTCYRSGYRHNSEYCDVCGIKLAITELKKLQISNGSQLKSAIDVIKEAKLDCSQHADFQGYQSKMLVAIDSSPPETSEHLFNVHYTTDPAVLLTNFREKHQETLTKLQDILGKDDVSTGWVYRINQKGKP